VLRWRLLVAFLIITPVVGLLAADYWLNFGAPGIWLSPAAVLLCTAAIAEVLDLLHGKDLRPAAWSVHVGSLLVVAAGMVPLFWPLGGNPYPADCPVGRFGWPLAAVAIAGALIFIAEMIRFRQPGQAVVNVALGVLIVVYISVPIAFLTALRLHHDNRWGMAALVSIVLIVKMSDTGAYFCGRLLGRHKMAPILSPKKTVEGGLGGLITAALVSLAFFYCIAPGIVGPEARDTSVWGCLLYGFLIGAAGVIGDLSESLLKRDLQRKDSSSWMPGLGGVLDVLDSLLLAAPVAYLCWAIGIVGP
jgi:phosphatidate cytidylyltransferase